MPSSGSNFYSSSNGTNNLNMHNILVNKFLASLLGDSSYSFGDSVINLSNFGQQ